jgi:hypothetical protein
MLYALLVLIAVGVLLISKEGKVILGIATLISVVGAVLYGAVLLFMMLYSQLKEEPAMPVHSGGSQSVQSGSEAEIVLSEARRKQLDEIVLKMTQQNATEREIQLIVDDFKKKYGNE